MYSAQHQMLSKVENEQQELMLRRVEEMRRQERERDAESERLHQRLIGQLQQQQSAASLTYDKYGSQDYENLRYLESCDILSRTGKGDMKFNVKPFDMEEHLSRARVEAIKEDEYWATRRREDEAESMAERAAELEKQKAAEAERLRQEAIETKRLQRLEEQKKKLSQKTLSKVQTELCSFDK